MELLSNVKKCWDNSIVISDHAAVSMEIHLGRFEHCSRWRLQVYLLQDTAFVKFVESRIDTYFELNTDGNSASIRWKAFKAYIRGEIISYISSKTKRHNQKLRTLENQI